MPAVLYWIFIAISATVLLLALFFLAGTFNLWVRALASNASVQFMDILFMRLRGIDIHAVVMSKIRLVKAGIDVSTNQLAQHYAAGGRLTNVVSALIVSRARRLDLSWETTAARDLSGHDVFAEAQAEAAEKDSAKSGT